MLTSKRSPWPARPGSRIPLKHPAARGEGRQRPGAPVPRSESRHAPAGWQGRRVPRGAGRTRGATTVSQGPARLSRVLCRQMRWPSGMYTASSPSCGTYTPGVWSRACAGPARSAAAQRAPGTGFQQGSGRGAARRRQRPSRPVRSSVPSERRSERTGWGIGPGKTPTLGAKPW